MQLQLPEWISRAKTSPMEKSLIGMQQRDHISFGLGLPSVELFPAEMCQQIVQRLFQDDLKALQYAAPSRDLKSHIVPN